LYQHHSAPAIFGLSEALILLMKKQAIMYGI